MLAFLGHLHDLSAVLADSSTFFEPNMGSREKFRLEVLEIFRKGRLLSGEVAHLRSMCSWPGTSSTGRPCRGA
eukprot:6576153-Pyramimonas_sp.AAC.1